MAPLSRHAAKAEEKRTELLGEKDKGELVAPSKLTVGAYLDEWLKTTEPSRAPKTHRLYAGIIKDHVKPALGNVLLQKLNVIRHTCATLLLAAGEPPHVVQRRLGHKSADITLNVYSHVLPSQQANAAERLSALLRG